MLRSSSSSFAFLETRASSSPRRLSADADESTTSIACHTPKRLIVTPSARDVPPRAGTTPRRASATAACAAPEPKSTASRVARSEGFGHVPSDIPEISPSPSPSPSPGISPSPSPRAHFRSARVSSGRVASAPAVAAAAHAAFATARSVRAAGPSAARRRDTDDAASVHAARPAAACAAYPTARTRWRVRRVAAGCSRSPVRIPRARGRDGGVRFREDRRRVPTCERRARGGGSSVGFGAHLGAGGGCFRRVCTRGRATARRSGRGLRWCTRRARPGEHEHVLDESDDAVRAVGTTHERAHLVRGGRGGDARERAVRARARPHVADRVSRPGAHVTTRGWSRQARSGVTLVHPRGRAHHHFSK